MWTEPRIRLVAAGAFVFVLAVDQTIKAVITRAFLERLACNPSGPWGVDVSNSVAIALSIGALGAVLYLWNSGFVSILPLALLLGAGLSNLVDRLIYGCVRDFVAVSWYPAFNPADVFLTAGAIIVVWAAFIHWKRPPAVAQ